MNIRKIPPKTDRARIIVALDVADIKKAIRLYVKTTRGETLPDGDTNVIGLDQSDPHRDKGRALMLFIDVTEPD